MEHPNFLLKRYTPEEYFALEAQSDVRHEYFDGEIFAKTGTSKAHNDLCLNLAINFKASLRGSGCRVQMENVRTAVQENFHYTYPDIVVSCDPDDHRDQLMVRHPVLLVEVLSPGTADYDRTGKFRQYQKLPTLRHYLLVAQTQWSLEHYRRNAADEWVFTALTEPDDVLEIPDLGLRLALADLYDDTGVPFLRVVPPGDGEKL